MEKAYNSIEAAALLGVKVSTIRKWLRSGKIRGKKIAGTERWIIMETEIKRLQGADVDDHAN